MHKNDRFALILNITNLLNYHRVLGQDARVTINSTITIIFNLFQRIFWGSFRFKKIPSSKKSQLDFRGVGGGGHHPFGLIPKFHCFFDWKASLRHFTSMWQSLVVCGVTNQYYTTTVQSCSKLPEMARKFNKNVFFENTLIFSISLQGSKKTSVFCSRDGSADTPFTTYL